MENPIKRIVQFNQQAGLIEKGYDDFLESSFQIEEALEGFDISSWKHVDVQFSAVTSPKDLSRVIVETCKIPEVSDVYRLDKACDAVVFAIGSMAKLGLNAQQITQALNIVMNANFKKLGAPKDEHGKQLKPKGWTGPEAELQTLLDKR